MVSASSMSVMEATDARVEATTKSMTMYMTYRRPSAARPDTIPNIMPILIGGTVLGTGSGALDDMYMQLRENGMRKKVASNYFRTNRITCVFNSRE